MAEESGKGSSSSSDAEIKPQTPEPSGYRAYTIGDYPALAPGSNPLEQMNGGAGIYAVPQHQFAGHDSALPLNYLIPLTYSVPTTRPSNEAGTTVEHQAQPADQRQVMERRFQIAFQLDVLLVLKLAAIVYLLNQDGSRQRLAALVISATIIYLYQTGVLAPFVRWLSQGMYRAAIPPPHPRRPAARAGNNPAGAMPLNQDVIGAD